MERLQALAPAHVTIEVGSCHSLCGNGPIVADDKDKKYRKVKGNDKILELLGSVNSDLLEGYELALEGDTAFQAKDYEKAIRLYEQAVDLAFLPALQLQNAREAIRKRGKYPASLEWLIRARRNEALCRLGTDLDGAMLAAQASCNLSRNTSWKSFLVLAKVYEEKKDVAGEWQALKNLLSVPVKEDKLSPQEKNERRTCGFRFDKLDRMMKQEARK